MLRNYWASWWTDAVKDQSMLKREELIQLKVRTGIKSFAAAGFFWMFFSIELLNYCQWDLEHSVDILQNGIFKWE